MRSFKIAAVVMFAAFSLPALAQVHSTPRIDQRQENQHDRIERGLRSGELTRREADRLFEQERRIRRMERQAVADGRISPHERARIEREQDQLSRRIARNTHDRQQRY